MFLGFSFAAAFPVAWYFLRGDGAGHKKPNAPAKRRSAVKRIEPATESRKKPARRNFKGASIQPGDKCCQAVRELTGKRFLVEETPRLPLERCDRIGECLCKYHNHPDRRADEGRRNVYGSMSAVGEIGMSDSNKRTGMDRRASVESELENIEFEN